MRKRRPSEQLVRLEYGTVYCELGKETISAGDLVAWWRVVGRGGRLRWAAYCERCHSSNVRAEKALR